MDLNQFTSSKFLAKTDVPDQGVNLTINGFTQETMQDKTTKLAVSWREVGVKPMLLNKTNLRRLTAIFKTSQTTAMLGQQVNVYNDPMIEMQGQMVGGLRLRPVPAPTAPVAAPAAEPFNDDIPF